MVLHVIPVRGSARDIFTQATALLVVTPVDRAAVPTAEVLQGLFDLTPAEARVARGIGQAETIDTLADATGVNRETVRSQLKAVLSKTGLSRQQELVSLLAGKAFRGGVAAATAPAPGRNCWPIRRRNRASARIRCEDKRPAQAGLFAAFFHCCVARTCFVHLPFRVKSAFANAV